MLITLSLKYQKEIALSFISLFFISGLAPLSAKAYNNYSTYNYYDHSVGKDRHVSSLRSKAAGRSAFDKRKTTVNYDQPVNANTLAALNKITVKSAFTELQHSESPMIGGPTQPEMSSFKSVGTDNMVNLFTGDFSYNIPLLDVGGYPVNLFYNSGITMDEEASWVGLGWNINPGTISRSMRGLPDDFNGSDKITKTQSMRPDQTWGINTGAGIEIAGLGLGLDVNMGLSFNNRLGVATEFGITPSMSISSKSGDPKSAGIKFSVGLDLSSRSGASVTPSIGLHTNENKSLSGDLSASLGYNSRMGLTNLHVSAEAHSQKKLIKDKHVDGPSYQGSNISFAYPSVTPTIGMPLTHLSFNANFKIGFEAFALHPHFSLGGFYNKTYLANSDKVRVMPAYGMMYLQNGNHDDNGLLDFNRIQDGVYTKTSPAIGMPTYSYDVFNISGEGVGGSFRAYRGDLGYVHDPYTSSREDVGTIGVELGVGNGVHVGGNLQYVYTPTTAGVWENSNLATTSFAFRNSKDTFQSVYFKNPGEKTIPDVNYQNAIGGEDLVRLQLNAGGSGTAVLAPTFERISPSNNSVLGTKAVPNLVKSRDKRTQVISSLTAEEAARVALDTAIYSYNPDTTKVIYGNCGSNNNIERIDRQSDYRKSHHISEINVLEQDGKKYVYGIPVYNVKQVDVTMGISNGNNNTLLSTYTSQDDSQDNQQGKDWYYEKQEIPPYAHSYLLTSLVSPNYVDIKGDGITEDDMGDAIRFNYSKSSSLFKWRTPATGASYNEGLKTFPKDDKAHYIYGEREQWYLYSIESKNLVARFYVNPRRSDGRSVAGQTGGLGTTGNQQLSRISLFSKADLTRQANNPSFTAKPIKTVYFVYSNRLCADNSGLTNNGTNANGEKGKLTLESIYFTYNGNEKQHKNKYTFHYPSDNNPNYNYTDNDRWGNYKPKVDAGVENNPGGLSNADYSYSIQDKTKADKYAAAWTMDSVQLPSGGKIGITYESDDYAFVQNRRAASMTQILGFGNTSNPNSSQITNPSIYESSTEFEYVYIQLPVAVTSGSAASMQRELGERYFADVKQLFMKLAVNMPPDDNGSNTGFELIPMYADIDQFGLIPGTLDQAFIKVKLLESGNTPMVQYAFAFMKNFLPHKAFPGYDVSDQGGLKSVLTALAGMFDSFSELTKGQDGKFMSDGKCKILDLDKSVVRLSNPTGFKYGGGLRVKKIVISDNWNKMTGQYTSTYGQEYKYTTTEFINNVATTMSSGVASWEPVIGGEENPHREIIKNLNRNKLGPFDYGATELPMGEMFYPGPSVGYSRVEVYSIHRDTVKNMPSRSVTEYFTTRDFPFKSNFSALDGAGKVDYETSPILKILHINLMHKTTVSQGFKVEINDMNGREKSKAVYSALDPVNAISKTTNYYNTIQQSDKTYTFNHQFKTLDKPDGVINPNGLIGRDIEVMSDFREHQSKTYTSNLTLNLDLFWIGWFPIPLFNPLSPFYVDDNTYRSAAVTKIVNHYAMLDSVVVESKGSTVSTKNMVYDAETGSVLLSRTNNEHNKPIYSFNYPAHWAYSGMGPAYKNIDVIFDKLVFRKGLLETPIYMGAFESGDEIYVLSEKDNGPLKTDNCDVFSCTEPYLVKNTAKRIWAVNTAKGGGNANWVFMDREGQPYTADQVKIKIIRSGHRNMLDQSIGSVTSMTNPIVTNGMGAQQIVFNDATNILNTTAATYKDNWRVDNAFYKVDSVTRSVSTVYPRFFTDTATQITTVTRDGSNYAYSFNNYPIISYLKRSDTLANNLERKAWIKFDGLIPHINSLNLDPSWIFSTQSYKTFINLHTHDAGCGSNHNGIHLIYPGSVPGGCQAIYEGDNCFANYAPFLGNASTSQLMQTPWYATSDQASWKYLFDHANNYTAPYSLNDWAIINPYPGYVSHASGQWYEMPNQMKKLIADNNNGLPVTPGFSFEIFYPNSGPGVQNLSCWWGSNGGAQNTPYIQVCYMPCTGGRLDSIRNGIGYCSIVTSSNTYCFSKMGRKAINPYVEGVLGNWRIDTTYTYYGERKEKDPTIDIDTRTAGTITGYNEFWNFNLPYVKRNNTPAARAVWAWNTAITQYNRKGFEVENTDPLGRYNSGLYGYNQQLPIAVTNNGRLRETMFDGFEDYDYQTGTCTETCKGRRHASFGDIYSSITEVAKHSGRYSLKVNAGQTLGFNAPVVNESTLDKNYNVRIKIDSVAIHDTTIVSQGTGLTERHYNQMHCPAGAGASNGTQYPSFGNIGHNWSVKWKGKLVPRQSNTYTFRGNCDDGFRIMINGTYITNNTGYGANSTNCNNGGVVGVYESNPVYLLKGEQYNIEIDAYNGPQGPGYFTDFQWKIGCMDFDNVPGNCLYPETFGNIVVTHTTAPSWCTKLDSVQVTGNALTDSFSLIQGRKMVIGAWVKEGGNDCKCSTYVNNNIAVSFTGATETYTLKPSGNIIEGWQRYEEVIQIPASATAISVGLKNLSGSSPVYFDDVRMHPYNANMKSFAYHSSNLRLMAELDENNYASFYEYDDNGTLTRVKKETIAGIKTVTESRSALQKGD